MTSENRKNKTIEALIKIFMSGFENVYKNIDKNNKKCILSYINSFFRKWYYSTVIDNTELSPAMLAGAANKEEYPLYPVISVSDNTIKTTIYEYNIFDHPIISDFKTIAEKVSDIIRFDEPFNVSDDFLYSVGNIISIPDKQYIEYIFMLGLQSGIFEKMPSVGITAVMLGKEALNLEKMDNRDIFLMLIDAAIALAADNLSEKYSDECDRIEWEDVADWLTEPMTVDEIFSECYGEIFTADALENFIMGNIDEQERAISANSFNRGVKFDKWFLTPFGYYFRLIEPIYLGEFSFYDELEFFISAYESSENTKIKDVIEAAIYSPCTAYRATKLCADVFEREYIAPETDFPDDITPEKIIEILSDGKMSELRKIAFASWQNFDVATLRISDFSSDKLWLDIDISAECDLDFLHLYISYIFGRDVLFCDTFKFYKLPRSPFTEYMPSYMGERGPKTNKTAIAELLNEGEECYYEAFFSSKDDEYYVKAKLTCKKISPCKKDCDYPRVSKLCKKLKEYQNQ